jgi:hypothetical protein
LQDFGGALQDFGGAFFDRGGAFFDFGGAFLDSASLLSSNGRKSRKLSFCPAPAAFNFCVFAQPPPHLPVAKIDAFCNF